MEQIKQFKNFLLVYDVINEIWIDGKIYEIAESFDENNKKDIVIASRQDGDYYKNYKDCTPLMSFIIRHPGCWDNRINFTDNEYFSEELKEMSNMFDIAEEFLKLEIIKMNPNDKYMSLSE